MNRAQFMEQLEKLLSDISEDERKEALEYYESYFDEAGPEKEAAVIQELGSPGKVAAIIKADLREHGEEYGEYTERGYYDERTEDPAQTPGRRREKRNRDVPLPAQTGRREGIIPGLRGEREPLR